MVQQILISLRNKEQFTFEVFVVSKAQAIFQVANTVNSKNPIVLFHCQDSPAVSLFDVSSLNHYIALFFDKKEASFVYRGCCSALFQNEAYPFLQNQHQLVLFLPYPIGFDAAEVKSLSIIYSNKNLNWPQAVESNCHFKIPSSCEKYYDLEILNPMRIEVVSNEDFLKLDDLMPLFIETAYGASPNLSSLHFLATEKCVRYATIQKSYLSGYYHGITFFEFGPNDSSPSIISRKHELHL